MARKRRKKRNLKVKELQENKEKGSLLQKKGIKTKIKCLTNASSSLSLRDYWEKAGGQGEAPGWPSDGGGGTVLDGGVGGVLFPSSGPTALNTRAKNVLPARRGDGISEIKLSSAVPGTDSFVTTEQS